MADRLPIDANVIGYWGFDEANGTDLALDESSYSNNLTVSGSAVASASRVGNARLFDGSTVFASPSSSTSFQVGGNLSLICWAQFTSLNSSGSNLRTLICCDGTTSGSADNTQYNLSVDGTGAVVLKHEHGSAVPVIFKSAGNVIQINKFFSIAVTRTVSAGIASALLYVNNVLVAWASITDNGVTTASPLAPSGGTTATLKIGKSGKASDSAYMAGLIDEVSIHNTARPSQPYLVAAYYRITLSVTSARLTAFGSIKSLGSADMGGGNRWWVYERDQNLFVVRENSLGFYSSEVQLTTSGTTVLGASVPGAVSQPEVLYDAASDTLLVSWLSANKVFKLTATAEDAPSTQNMPYSADTSGQVKVDSITEAFHDGVGGGDQPRVFGGNGDGGSMGEATPGSITIQFANLSALGGFGVMVPDSDAYGYALFQVRGGAAQRIATLSTVVTGSPLGAYYYFYPISVRVTGTQYYVRPLRKNGTLGVNYSNVITDWTGSAQLLTADGLSLKVNSDGGDIPDGYSPGIGEATDRPLQDLIYLVNHQPLKVNAVDPDASLNTVGCGGGTEYPLQSLVSYVNRSPLKISYQDPDTSVNTVGCGASSDHLQIGSSGRSIQIIQ
jgi:hypothetical protein